MARNLERPKFIPSLLKSLVRSAERRGLLAIFPAWLVGSAIVGGATTHFIPSTFWSSHLEVAAVVYVGILTLNGLVLALSWSAFSRIHECIGAPGFCSYLMDKDLMTGYITYIDFAHLTQLFAILASAAGLMLLLMGFRNTLYNEVAFAAMIAASIYAIKEAAGSVKIMHDLLWQKAIFDDHLAAQGGGNIVPFWRGEDKK